MSKYSFGEYNSTVKLKNLISKFEIFEKDDTNISLAFELSTDAWHLTDFVFEEYKDLLNLTNLGDFRAGLYSMCDKLKIIHDLANASKHGGELRRPKANIEKTEIYIGDFSSDFSSDFDTDYLKITLDNNLEFDFYEIILEVIEFWRNYFKSDLNIEI